MTDRLRELLDQKPTQGEVDYADTLADSLNWECVSGNPRPRMAQGRADHRLSLVRETMRECAKVVEGFASDYPADIFPDDRWNALDDAAKTNLAGVIMRVMLPRIAKRLLAETEAK